MTDTIEVFREAMNRIIPPPESIIADGSLHRYTVPGDKAKSDNGWYVLHADDPAAGAFGCWKRDISETWCVKSYQPMTPAEKAAYTAKMDAIKQARETEKKRKQAECRKMAAYIWGHATEKGTDQHPYTIRKGIKPYAVRTNDRGNLIIPVYSIADDLQGLQFIQPDGSKKFLTGTAKEGNFSYIGDSPIESGTIIVCEGLATGCSLHEATGLSVVVAFDAGNLKHVAEAWRHKLPDAQIIIAGDDDHATEGNPGRTKATAAAQAVNTLVVFPAFRDATGRTDFNDMHQEQGLDEVRQQIEPAIASAHNTAGFEIASYSLKPFPFSVIPAPFDSLVEEYATGLQTQPEYVAMLMMAILSGAIGNTVNISPKRGWYVPPFIWFLLIDDTGEGKSHPARAMMAPVNELQSRAATQHEQSMAEYNLQLAAYKADKKNNPLPSAPEPMRHYYTSNFTIEALIPMYKATARGLITHIDEAAGLIKGLNQYKSGGNDYENILSLFDAGALKSDRKTGNGYVRDSGTSFVGGIQRGVFDSLFREIDYASGLVYRFMPMLGNAPPALFTLDSVSIDATQAWNNAVDWMYSIPVDLDPASGRIKSLILTIDSDALDSWTEFQHRYSKSKPFLSPKFRGYVPKLITYCLKFAATLHIMECHQHDAIATTIGGKTMRDAIALTEYFAGQARELVNGAVEERDPYRSSIRQIMEQLRKEGESAPLLNQVRDRLNGILPHSLQMDSNRNKHLATIMREMGYRVETGAGNKTFVSENC